MINDIEVVGVGMHPFGRFPRSSLKDLARVAIARALHDAGLSTKDVDAVYAANAMGGLLSGQEMIRGQTVTREVGIEGVPVVNVENACASGSSAVQQAVLAVQAGAADRVLVVGFEKMFVDDREATLKALRSAADLEVVDGLGVQFTAVYAMRLKKRLDEGALTFDDLVQSAVKSHHHGALNPYAQHQKPVTRDEVVTSRRIADPLTLMMCGSISDGAAAAVITRRHAVAARGRPRVLVRASAARSGTTQTPTTATAVNGIASRCAHAAYEQSGVSPSDADVVEVHDAVAPGELLYYEQLGLCAEGEAGQLLRSGRTSLGGDLVVNPSGGLSSRGHPVGATGVAQLAEIVWQLRHEAGERQVEGARIGLAQNSGGWLEGDSAACNIHVLERVDP